MNICQIGTFINDSENSHREAKAIGGIAGYINNLVNYLLENNHFVFFIGKIFHYQQRSNLTYHEIQKTISSTNRFLTYLFFKSFFIKLPINTIIHAHRPDHFILFSWFRKNPSVLTIHGQQFKTIYSRKGLIIKIIYKLLENIALKKVDFIIATDNITSNLYLKTYPWIKNKLKVIPTGIDTNQFHIIGKRVCREKLNISQEKRVIMFIGRIEPPKRIEDIIHSFQQVHQKHPNTILFIIGDGILLNAMKLLVKENNLTNAVVFTGAIMRKELPYWINAADLTILYSYNEGSPLSLKESLACGVPVISNCVGDVNEIIINGINGYLLEKEDNNTLSNLIIKALFFSEISPVSCVKSISKYTLEIVNKNIELVYNQL